MKYLQLILALPFMLVLALAAHALLARGVKAVLWAWSPLASGEPEAASYERRVYHTADMPMTQIVIAAATCGLPLWIGLATGTGAWWALGIAGLVAVVGLDVHRWERVAVSGHNLWFQRGFRGKVHQVALENIRDASVEEIAAQGFTLRYGRKNRLVRLNVRLTDKRVIALPKTDAHAGLEAVESVANHLRLLIQQARDRDVSRRRPKVEDLPPPGALSAGEPTRDEDLQRALAKLRARSLKAAGKPPVSSGSAH